MKPLGILIEETMDPRQVISKTLVGQVQGIVRELRKQAKAVGNMDPGVEWERAGWVRVQKAIAAVGSWAFEHIERVFGEYDILPVVYSTYGIDPKKKWHPTEHEKAVHALHTKLLKTMLDTLQPLVGVADAAEKLSRVIGDDGDDMTANILLARMNLDDGMNKAGRTAEASIKRRLTAIKWPKLA